MMSGWRLARSLDVLRGEIHARRPGTTVWTIGDQDHADTWSDHNPTAGGVVCAIDVLGDRGLDLADFADRVVRSDPPALKYVIWRDRIWLPGYGWQPYRGTYHKHVHVSVGVGPDGRSTGPVDDTTPWNLWKEADMPLTPADAQLVAKAVAAHELPDPRKPGKTVPISSLLRYAEARHQDALAAIKAIPAATPVELDYDQLAAALLRTLAKEAQ